jgi:hypothetical protein
MKPPTLFLMAVTLLAGLVNLRADGAHEPGQSIKLIGKIDFTADFSEQCEFSTDIEPVSFRLISFKDKYKVVRIRVENRKAQSIKLSVENDSVELVMPDKKVVKGTLNLKAQDGLMWDSLDDEMRKILAYPLSIRAAKVADGGRKLQETVLFFAFFPADKVPAVPRSVRFRIESLGKTITLEQHPTAAE